MTVPDFQTAMRPALAVLADGTDHQLREVVAALADHFRLSDEDRAELIPSGRSRRFYGNVSWALTYLSQAGLVQRPARGHVQITEAGRAVLTRYPDRIDMKVLEQFPAYTDFVGRTRERAATEQAVAVTEAEEQSSPVELLNLAVAQNETAVESELLTQALGLDPTGFERLVLAVLEEMGYGRSGAIEHSRRPGDAGIDGIISQDPLGLDRIYLQAKRYDPGNSVQRPDIQRFVGALMSARGDRGVFINTSTFSAGARTEAERVSARIELIDGPRLASLMLRHGVGVRAVMTVVLHELDEDFFESV